MSNEILFNLLHSYKLILLNIFNEIFISSDYPAAWLDSFIYFIKKSDGQSMRPIALTPCFCKVFERMLKLRIEWWLEFNNLIHPSQTGFRKGRSCLDNLTNLSLFIQEGFANKKDTLAAFLDVKGAFLNVNSEILLDKLANILCSFKVIKFIRFLTNCHRVFLK